MEGLGTEKSSEQGSWSNMDIERKKHFPLHRFGLSAINTVEKVLTVSLRAVGCRLRGTCISMVAVAGPTMNVGRILCFAWLASGAYCSSEEHQAASNEVQSASGSGRRGATG